MRKLFGFAFLIFLAAYVKFGNTVTEVDYHVKTAYGELPNHLANKNITYHVPGVVRIAGADIHRPAGYFTHPNDQTHKERAGQVVSTMVNSLSMGATGKLDVKKAKLLGLEPVFGFWQEKGKWILLFGVVLLLCIFFWR
jgi:hypothetical protein